MIINGKEAKMYIVDEENGLREIGGITDFTMDVKPDAKPIKKPLIKDLNVSIQVDARELIKMLKRRRKYFRYMKRIGRSANG